jgi:predicted PurR-regulated permease PerM
MAQQPRPHPTTRSEYWLWSLLAVSAGVLGFTILPFAQPILVGLIMAVLFAPFYTWLRTLVANEDRAALLATLAVILLVVVPLAWITVMWVQQGAHLYRLAADESAKGGGWVKWLTSWTEGPLGWIAARTGTPVPDLRAAVMARLGGVSSSLLALLQDTIANIAGFIADTTFSFVVLYGLFRYSGTIRRVVDEWSPVEPAILHRLLDAISNAIVANVYGTGAVAAVQGVLLGIGLTITGSSSAVFWALSGTLCSFIPVVGPAIIWVPVSLYLFSTGALWQAIFLVAWGVLVVGLSDNFVRPLMVQDKMGVNGLIIFFVLLGSFQMFGMLGLFAGPAILSCAVAILEILAETRRGSGGRPT